MSNSGGARRSGIVHAAGRPCRRSFPESGRPSSKLGGKLLALLLWARTREKRMGAPMGFLRNRTMTAEAGRRAQAGVMLIEVLIAILICSIGVLAVVGMQVAAINNVTDAKYRSEAAFLTNRLISQIWTDIPNIATYDYPGTGTLPASLANWVNDPKV